MSERMPVEHEKNEVPAPVTLVQIRQQLKGQKGKNTGARWTSLANTPEFQAAVEREFPGSPHEWGDDVSRRGFLKFMGASAALAGLAVALSSPTSLSIPTSSSRKIWFWQPNYLPRRIPFVTGAVPLLVKSDQYRPIKIDGNPEHPYNQGASDPFTQGALLDLYDPDRSQHVSIAAKIASGRSLRRKLRLKVAGTKDGTGIYFLSSTITSPTLARQWGEVKEGVPEATLVQYDPAIAGTSLASGLNVQYDLAEADVIDFARRGLFFRERVSRDFISWVRVCGATQRHDEAESAYMRLRACRLRRD